MSDDGPLKEYLEVRDLGPHGYEVVVSLVNESEEITTIRRVTVEVLKDEVPCGRHRVVFPGQHDAEPIRLGQFEIAEGHFHLDPEQRAHELHFRVDMDWHCGEHEDSRRISRRIATGRIARKH